MAAIRSGLFPYNCSICQIDPNLKEALGCETPAQSPVWEYDGDRFFSCPYRLIPTTVFEWVDEHTYVEKFPHTHTDSVEQVSAKWWEAYLLYTRCISECEQERMRRTHHTPLA